MILMILSALFFPEASQKADIETTQQRYDKASSFLSEFGYTKAEIKQLLNKN
jgi:hypothetical protein